MARDIKKKRDRDRLLALKNKYPRWVKAHDPRAYEDLLRQGLVEAYDGGRFRITSKGLASFSYKKWGRDEDRRLLELVGKKSNTEIAEILGRPVGGVVSAMRRLNVSNMRYGQAHWNAKVDDLLVSMILTLHDAGYAPAEIENFVNQPRDIKKSYIEEVLTCRTRSNPAQLVERRCSSPERRK